MADLSGPVAGTSTKTAPLNRRDSLLDAAGTLLAAGDVAGVTMESVASASGVSRALVEGALAAQASRGATFAALLNQGGRPTNQRAVQRRRDRATIRYFAALAVAELGLEQRQAITGVQLALGGIALVLQQWRHRPTPEHAAELADAYVAFAMGGLRRMSSA